VGKWKSKACMRILVRRGRCGRYHVGMAHIHCKLHWHRHTREFGNSFVLCECISNGLNARQMDRLAARYYYVGKSWVLRGWGLGIGVRIYRYLAACPALQCESFLFISSEYPFGFYQRRQLK